VTSGVSPAHERDASRGSEEETAGPEDAESFYQARTRKEAALAELRRIEAARMRGELVLVTDAEEILSTVSSTLRTRLLEFPESVAHRLADRRLELGQVVSILDEVLRDLLGEIAAAPPFGGDEPERDPGTVPQPER